MHVSFILFTEYILINFQTMFKIDTYLIDFELHFWSNSWTIVKHEGSGYIYHIHVLEIPVLPYFCYMYHIWMNSCHQKMNWSLVKRLHRLPDTLTNNHVITWSMQSFNYHFRISSLNKLNALQ